MRCGRERPAGSRGGRGEASGGRRRSTYGCVRRGPCRQGRDAHQEPRCSPVRAARTGCARPRHHRHRRAGAGLAAAPERVRRGDRDQRQDDDERVDRPHPPHRRAFRWRSPATSAPRCRRWSARSLPDATVVCEASSFQLEDTEQFAPEVAVLLNISPDHLDRHGELRGLRGGQAADLRPSGRRRRRGHARRRWSLSPVARRSGCASARAPGGAASGSTASSAGAASRCCRRPRSALPGAHNVQNAMAAAAACLARDLPRAGVAEGLRTFAGVRPPARAGGERGGAFATSTTRRRPTSTRTLVALRSFRGDVHLILGGRGQVAGFAPLATLVSERCAAVYLIGEDADDDRRALAGTGVPLMPAGDLERAVTLAAPGGGGDGAVVLLSPACASYRPVPRLRGPRRPLPRAGPRSRRGERADDARDAIQPHRRRRSSTGSW